MAFVAQPFQAMLETGWEASSTKSKGSRACAESSDTSGQAGLRHPDRGAQAAGVPRVRLGRRLRAVTTGSLAIAQVPRADRRPRAADRRRRGDPRRHASASPTPAGPPTASPTEVNAHPHYRRRRPDRPGPQRHHRELRHAASSSSQSKGHVFRSRDRHRGAGPPDRRVLPRRRDTSSRPSRRPCARSSGTYGIAVICADEPDKIVAARKGSPLIIGVGKDEYIVASRRLGHHRAHRQRRSTSTTTRWPSSPATGIRTTTHRQRAGHQGGRADRVVARADRAAAATSTSCSRRSSSSPRRSATACAAGWTCARGGVMLGGLGQRDRELVAGPARSSSPPAARPGTPGWSASTCSRTWPASPPRSSTPASSATATRSSRTARSSSPSASPARRPTRWPPCARPSERGAPGAGHRQRRRLDHRPRDRRRRLPARRAGDRRGLAPRPSPARSPC